MQVAFRQVNIALCEVNIVFHQVNIALRQVNIAWCEVNIALVRWSTSIITGQARNVDLTRYQLGACSRQSDDGGVWWVQQRGR